MNDRLRFRAWDKSFQKYYENVIVSTINGEITVYGRLVNGDTVLIPSAHVVLEQCTGLKDKNGKFIYEGDMLLLDPDDPRAFVVWDEDVAMFCIEQEDVCYTFDNCGYSPQEMEVIGNIHE